MRLGVVETAHWSPLWGSDARTASWATLSFPRRSYVIDLLEPGERLFASVAGALLINPGTPFRRDPRYRADLANDFLAFDPTLVREVASAWDPAASDREAAPFPAVGIALDTPAFRIHRLLLDYAASADEPDPLVVEETGVLLLRHLLATAYQGLHTTRPSKASTTRPSKASTTRPSKASTTRPSKASTTRYHREVVEEAKEYIGAHLSRPLRLAEIARAVGVAPAHFCVVFRRMTGQTVHEFVRELRLRTAYDRLPEYRGSLTDLALGLGFSDGSHFSASFREWFDEPPSRVSQRAVDDDSVRLLSALTRACAAEFERSPKPVRRPPR
ncbi:MAG: AraC family transcriptional regulator [Candidatus Eisenbacteria bacterium]